MPYERELNPSPHGKQPLCLHYRSKAMYVTGELDPSHVDEQHNHDQNCWCNLTQHVLGPDQRITQRDQCIPSRGCFRGG